MTDSPKDVIAFRAAMDSAARILARRDHASAELARKLERRGVDHGVIERVIAECRRLNYLNDDAAAVRYVEELKKKGFGRRYVRGALRNKGFSGTHIETALSERYDASEEMDAGRYALRRKARTFDGEEDDFRRRQKIGRYLYGRGFSPDVISALSHSKER